MFEFKNWWKWGFFKKAHENGRISHLFKLKNDLEYSKNFSNKISLKAKNWIGDKNSSFDSCWINHIEYGSKRIYKNDLEEYLKDGWTKGRKISKKYPFKVTEGDNKRIYVNNNIISKRILFKNLQINLDNGWIRGKL